LEEIIDLDHPLVPLAREIDWGVPRSALCQRVRARSGPTRPAEPAGGAVHFEAHANLADEVLCARWLENPCITNSSAAS